MEVSLVLIGQLPDLGLSKMKPAPDWTAPRHLPQGSWFWIGQSHLPEGSWFWIGQVPSLIHRFQPAAR